MIERVCCRRMTGLVFPARGYRCPGIALLLRGIGYERANVALTVTGQRVQHGG